MRKLYTVLFYLCIPLILIRLLWKARGNRAYLDKIPERFGFITYDKVNPLWIHAVSVGEVMAISPLVKVLLREYPDLPLIITTMTPTGAERVKSLFKDTVTHSYVPYDIPGALNRFIKRVRPKALLIVETELWPNLLYYAHRYNLPVMLANARLSATSAKGYQRIKNTTKTMLSQLSMVAVQTEEEKKRFIDLGLSPEKITVTANIKFDMPLPDNLDEKIKLMKKLLGDNRQVLLAASTHDSEEELILTIFEKLQKKINNLLCVIVPRHPERFPKVAALCERKGLSFLLRSTNKPCDANTQVLLGDSMGELMTYYGVCDITFVGGSFVNTGGHNLLEPAMLGLPIVTGPHMFNFAEITRLLVDAQGTQQVSTPEELENTLLALLQDKKACEEMGRRAKDVVSANKGALDRHVVLVGKVLLSGDVTS